MILGYAGFIVLSIRVVDFSSYNFGFFIEYCVNDDRSLCSANLQKYGSLPMLVQMLWFEELSRVLLVRIRMVRFISLMRKTKKKLGSKKFHLKPNQNFFFGSVWNR